MAKIKASEKVIFFAGLLLSDICLLDEGKKSLESLFGPIDLQSRIIPFTHTNYYNHEMGEHIVRLWVSFSEDSDPEHLSDWKIKSNRLEETWAESIIQPPLTPASFSKALSPKGEGVETSGPVARTNGKPCQHSHSLWEWVRGSRGGGE